MKKIYSVLILGCLIFLTGGAFAQTITQFNYTGSVQTYTVPACVTSVYIDAQGAPGGMGGYLNYPEYAGNGGRVQAVMTVTPGQVLFVYVGGTGASKFGNTTVGVVAGGFNGGGSGYYYYCGGGGGASDIRTGGSALANRVIVAGGGGGAAYNCSSSEMGGAGGGTTGGNGYYCGSYSSCYGGSGGTQTAGGTVGTCYSQPSGAGTLGQGGSATANYYSGGGGGGYYGGGCAGSYGGGGGGSSYPAATGGAITSLTHTQGYNGNAAGGMVIISTSAPTVLNYTGAAQTYTVPAGMNKVAVDVIGASGGNGMFSSYSASPGGAGGRVQATIAVSAGQVLNVYVGGAGASYYNTVPGTTCAGGYNGGGTGYYGYCGGGGGATDIRVGGTALSNRIVVAGGGGGAAYNYTYGMDGGAGGGLTAGSGLSGGSYSASYCGTGGSQTAGGIPGTSYTQSLGTGTAGVGGSMNTGYYGGGGGGGYWGGGSSGSYGGGGGGSSYTANGVSSAVHTQGYNKQNVPNLIAGNGQVIITPLLPMATAVPSSLAFSPTTVGGTSAMQIFALSGFNLDGSNLTLTPPSGFQISLDGSTFSSSARTYSYTGDFSNTFIYVQFAPTVSGAASGNVTVTGGALSCTLNIAVTGTGAAACSGVPTAGTASVSPTSGNSSTSFTLNTTGTSVAGGLTYQWQSSSTGASGTFTNISGANSIPYTFAGLTGNTWYQCVVTCPSFTAATTNTVTATFTIPSSSCTPAFAYNCSSYPMSCSINSLTGFAGSISDPGACGPNYVDNTGSMSVTLLGGTTYALTYGLSTTYYCSFAAQVWIDFNDDGVFTSGESVGGFTQGTYCVTTPVGSITLPAGAAPGAHRMRIVGIYNPTGYGFPNYPAIPPCPTSSIYYGNVRDYKVIIPPPAAALTTTTVNPFGYVTINTSSAPVGFTQLTGTNLAPSTGLLTATAPANYLVSLNGSTWVSSLPVPYTGGALSTNLYVQFNPTSVATYSGNVAFTGGGLSSTVNVAVTGNGQAACSGTPTAGTAAISPSSGGSANLFKLTLSGVSTVGGLTYQWQSSPDNTTWTNITGAISATYQFVGITANTYFRCNVTCPTGSTSPSSSVLATNQAMAASSCTPNFTYTCSSYPMSTSINSLIGASGSISDPASCGPNYVDNTSTMSVTLSAGTNYSMTWGVSTSYYTYFTVQAWIDFNDNGIFETTESVGGIPYGSIASVTPVSTITIPSGAASGTHRMRVTGNYTGGSMCCGASNYPSMNPCPTTAINYGNVRDYKVNIGAAGALPAAPCAGAPVAGIVSPSQITGCSAFTSNLFNVGETINNTGITYQWQTSSSPTSGFTPISGATGQGYIAAASTVGTVYYRQSVTCVNSGVTSTTPSQGITLNTLPASIAGTTTICNGFASTLSDATSGGIWTSSNTSVATVGSTSGVVTSVAVGSATITYTAGCFVTAPITINPQPAAITGTTLVCQAFSSTLSDATSGGTWSSSNPGIATVGSSSGVVTGVSGGNPVISYTLPTGCSSTTNFTVSPIAPISGLSSLCLGFGTTLSDPSSGGTWSSSIPGVAIIGSTSGAVSSISLGATTISYTLSSSGCSALMTLNVTNPPNVFTVTGGGSYCATGTGVHVGLISSDAGIFYSLYNGATLVATATGSGSSIDFGLFTGSGTYGVIAAYGTPCATTMAGTVTVNINPLPTPYSVSGGGGYCAGGTGMHIYLNSSTIGVNYQLKFGSSPIGSPVSGTSASLDFGLQTTAGAYTVVGTNTITGCVGNMSGSATVSINPLPTVFSLTGGGPFCAGSTGQHVGLSGSASGFSYQLLFGGAPLGAPLSGTGSPLDFGIFTAGGNYTVVATNTTTGCSTLMSGTSVIVVNPLPTVFTVTGGGSYCAGGAGVAVGLNGSTAGVNYQLYLGATLVGSAAPGTGAAISFGLVTGAGSYTVVATNFTTGCVNNMSGSVAVSINSLPTVYSMTGGGGYCAGGTGVFVGLSGSTVGVNYQLFNGTTLVGAASGSGGPINFGLYLAAGVYSVNAINATTGCTAAMAGTVTITINALPTVFSVTGGGNYCAGGTGVLVGLSGSASGVNYQLFNSGSPVGSPVAGTGSAISFGLQTSAGTYTAVAVNSSTTCTSNMSGSVSIIINPLPVVYTVTGGGGYCAGGTGTHVGLSASNSGINYQLMSGGSPVGSAIPGTGSALDFGLITTAGTYTVIASNPSTTCSTTMGGSAVVNISGLPAVYGITGGGNYCAGGIGVHIGLANSATGVNYQLMNGSSVVGAPLAGTGSPLDFGLKTAAGTYTVVATNATTGCVNIMTGSVTIGISPLPGLFAVTGGGNYCAGGTGVHIGLSGSASGINYQLFNGSTITGTAIAGTGGLLDFGLQTAAGTYTIVATDATTLCTNNMVGSVVITINPLPGLYTVTGGGNYCTGGTGLHIGLSGSATGISYQLLNAGTPVGAPMTGTGFAIDFGLKTTAGIYSVFATNLTTGCVATMTGTTTIVVNSLPVIHAVTGGGNYCVGGTGVTVGLDGSNSGTSYQLYNGAVAVGSALTGTTGFPVNFGFQTGLGTYTVIATNGTSCTSNMTGSATVGVNPLPVVYNVTGGGNYCTGGVGVHIGLSGSNSGITYQLWNGSTAVGGPVTGSGTAIDFGLQSTLGTYTVKATVTATGCINTMSGSVVIGISPLPAVHTVTGGGNYCTGGTGVHVSLNGSDAGVSYQLFNGGSMVGSPMSGTGSPLDFGLQTGAGVYTVAGTNTSTTCVSTMTGSVLVGIDPLPAAYTLTGGGNFCSGGSGVDITLSASDPGVNYQLFNGGTAIGAPMPGTGFSLDFGMQTAAGAYTIIGTSTTTTCSNTMTNTVIITVNPLPAAFNVTGGGNYCAGGPGVHIMLSGSSAGIMYQLMSGVTPVGLPIAGTGLVLDFGLHTTTGSYTVVAANTTTTCTNNMTGSVTIGINPLPNVYALTSISSSYCAGGAGVDMTLGSSDPGTSYQLYNGATPVGSPMSGSGSVLDFGYQHASGIYSVNGFITGTGCSINMSGGVTITINSLPAVYTVTGGGGYCSGGNGVHVGLSGSGIGISYQLISGGSPVGGIVSGTGSAIDFGLQSVPGSYSVSAVNPTTTCTNNMSGSVSVVVNPVPAAFTVTGGGNYCTGGPGSHVGLSGSALGVNYQLYKGGISSGSPVAGTGLPLDFGNQTTGSYTVVASNAIGGCANTMTGSVNVGTNPAPAIYSMIGGGSICPGGPGVHVGISGSSVGTNYQLLRAGVSSGLPQAGTGYAVDFGLQTTLGAYTVVATNTTTGCTANMTGSVSVLVNTLPDVFTVLGGGNYCAGGAGVHVGLSNSVIGISYSLYRGGITLVATLSGSGGPLDFGNQTIAGTYTIIAANITTGCSSNMTGSATVTMNPLVAPFVSISTGVGDTICDGSFTTFTANTLNGGTSPTYQWTVNGMSAGVGGTYSYVPANGDVVGVTLTSSALCASPALVSSSKTMTVDPRQAPTVNVGTDPGTIVCQGTTVTFTANTTYGGLNPAYTWMKNGAGAGTLSPIFSYTPNNGDVVYCVLTSDYHCRLANTASSAHLNIEVDVPATPVVTITATPGLSIAPGQTVTFTATVTSAGPSPSYQWLVNNVPISGATMQTFLYSNFYDGDTVTCHVLSSGGCSGTLGSKSVPIHVIGVGVKPVTTAGGDIKLVPNPNKGTFTVKGNLGVPIAIGTDEEVSLEITDMLGQVIYTSKVIARNGELNAQIELSSSLANGMYILNLHSGTENKVFHLVVEQ